MFKKLIATAVATMMLLGGTMALSAESDVTTGVFSSAKTLEMQWVEYKDNGKAEYLMITDRLRVDQRLKSYGSPDGMVHGIRQDTGEYLLFIETLFGVFPGGITTWEEITKVHFPQLKDNAPERFTTAMGYEDIWAYFEYDEEGTAKVKQLIRALNAEDLLQYEGNGGR